MTTKEEDEVVREIPNKNASRKEVEIYADKLYNGNIQRISSYLKGWFHGNFNK